MSFESNVLIASTNFLYGEGLLSYFNRIGAKSSKVVVSQDQLERSIVHMQPELVVIQYKQDHFLVEKTIAFLSITSPAKVIVLGDNFEKEKIDLYKKLGVAGMSIEDLSELELNQMIEAVLKGGTYFSEGIEKIASFDKEKALKETCKELNISDRELEIITLIAEGFINKEIADRLFLSPHTVNTHRKNIMSKLGVNNTSGIVLFAVKEHLVSPKEFLFSSNHKNL